MESKDKDCNTPLKNALSNNHFETADCLLGQYSASDYDTKVKQLMFEYSKKGMINYVKYLYEKHHVNIEARDFLGQTPLIIASRRNDIALFKYLHEKCHADTKATDNFGFTPMSIVIQYGFIDIVKYLFEECNADRNEIDLHGFTPLRAALEYKHYDIVKYLFKVCNVDKKEMDLHGFTTIYDELENDNNNIVKTRKRKSIGIFGLLIIVTCFIILSFIIYFHIKRA